MNATTTTETGLSISHVYPDSFASGRAEMVPTVAHVAAPAKTRGEVVAEKAITPENDSNGVGFLFANYGYFMDSNRSTPPEKDAEYLRMWFAAAIDAERADATKSERESCAALLDAVSRSHDGKISRCTCLLCQVARATAADIRARK